MHVKLQTMGHPTYSDISSTFAVGSSNLNRWLSYICNKLWCWAMEQAEKILISPPLLPPLFGIYTVLVNKSVRIHQKDASLGQILSEQIPLRQQLLDEVN